MDIHVDYSPIPKCLHPDLTYGAICIKCGECGRFNYGGINNPVRSEIKIVVQFDYIIPPGWQYPQVYGGYYDSDKAKGKREQFWYRNDKPMKQGTKLSDLINEWCYPERKLGYVRWWIEGRNY